MVEANEYEDDNDAEVELTSIASSMCMSEVREEMEDVNDGDTDDCGDEAVGEMLKSGRSLSSNGDGDDDNIGVCENSCRDGIERLLIL